MGLLGDAGRSKAAFARDDAVMTAVVLDDKRLDDPKGLDGLRQLVECLVVKKTAGLFDIGLNLSYIRHQVSGGLHHFFFFGRKRRRLDGYVPIHIQQRAQAAPQSFFAHFSITSSASCT
jgi:hypothetical protein